MTAERLRKALIIYAGLAGAALMLLKGPFLWMILVLLAALALKSWIAFQRQQL